MTEGREVQTLLPFLGLTGDEVGRPKVFWVIMEGTTSSLHLPLLWPSVKEQEAIEQGRQSLSEFAAVPAADDGGPSPSFDRYREAAEILPAVLVPELADPADGTVVGGFANLEPDGGDVLVRLYMHINDEAAPRGRDTPVAGLPPGVEDEVAKRNLRIVARHISSADYQVLDALYERILLHCALRGCRTLFVKLRGKGEGLEAGVREAIRRANPGNGDLAKASAGLNTAGP